MSDEPKRFMDLPSRQRTTHFLDARVDLTPEAWEEFEAKLKAQMAKADPREQMVILLDPADEADPFDGEPYDPENDWHEEGE